MVAALFFGLSLFLSPIFLAIPSFATAPALIIVGFLMVSSILKIDFNDFTEAIPSYIAIIAMPFMYSISEGIAMGVISYVVINLISGKAKEKKIKMCIRDRRMSVRRNAVRLDIFVYLTENIIHLSPSSGCLLYTSQSLLSSSISERSAEKMHILPGNIPSSIPARYT